MISIEVKDKSSVIHRRGSFSRPLELLQVSVRLAVVALCMYAPVRSDGADCDHNSLFWCPQWRLKGKVSSQDLAELHVIFINASEMLIGVQR